MNKEVELFVNDGDLEDSFIAGFLLFCISVTHSIMSLIKSSSINQDSGEIVATLDDSDYCCTICLHAVLKKKSFTGRRFGLLDCKHVFCGDCILLFIKRIILVNRSRFIHQEDELLEKAIVCPACWKPSTVVMSSRKLLLKDIEKAEYKKKFESSLSKHPCPFVRKGIPVCYCSCQNHLEQYYINLSCSFPMILMGEEARGAKSEKDGKGST